MPQWIPAVTALIAVVLGPLVSIYVVNRQIKASTSIADRQIKATVVSTNRIAWINAFRDLVADYITSMAIISQVTEIEDSDIKNVAFLSEKVKLFFDLTRSDHLELHNKLGSITIAFLDRGDQTDPEALDSLDERISEGLREITALTQELLKREWERVKEGE